MEIFASIFGAVPDEAVAAMIGSILCSVLSIFVPDSKMGKIGKVVNAVGFNLGKASNGTDGN